MNAATRNAPRVSPRPRRTFQYATAPAPSNRKYTTMGFIPRDGGGDGSRDDGVHGATNSNSTGRPRYPAPSTVIGIAVSGSVPFQAFRSSAYVSGVRDGVAGVKLAMSSPAATNTFCQSTGGEGVVGLVSFCGGAAAKWRSRPFVSTVTV